MMIKKVAFWSNLASEMSYSNFLIEIHNIFPFQALIIEKSMHKIKDEPFDDNDIEKFCLKLNRDMNDILNVYLQHNVIQEHESFSRNKVL